MEITKEDLKKEVSLSELEELTDLNNTGFFDGSVFDDAASDALAYVESYFDLPENPTPLLKQIGVFFTLLELKRKNGLPLSEIEKERKKDFESKLTKMANGKLRKEATGTEKLKKEKTTTIIRAKHPDSPHWI